MWNILLKDVYIYLMQKNHIYTYFINQICF